MQSSNLIPISKSLFLFLQTAFAQNPAGNRNCRIRRFIKILLYRMELIREKGILAAGRSLTSTPGLICCMPKAVNPAFQNQLRK